MRVQGNWLSLMSWRSFTRNSSDLDASLQKLSSGLRVSTASDDVAGLAVSESLLAQYKGLMQATRNALDGISLLNTAEGALQEIHDMLGRGKELAIQAANGVLTTDGRRTIQVEIDNILAEVNRIADTTTYNGRRLFNAAGTSTVLGTVINGLRSSWLEQASNLIRDQYGIEGDGAALTIKFESNGPSAAWISGTPGINGVLDNLQMHINLGAFGLQTNGTADELGGIANDRKVARALTLATLARSVDFYNLPSWFKSGVADLIAGRDEQLLADINAYGITAVVDAISTPWQEDSIHQSSAYLLVKYLASQMPADGMKAIMTQLSLSGGNADLDTALMNSPYGMDSLQLLSDFQDPGAFGGAAFASTLLLTDTDVGAIQTGDNQSVIPDDGTYSDNPLDPMFDLAFDASATFDPVTIALQVGANVSDRIELVIPHVSTLSLGLVGVDVVSRTAKALDDISNAIGKLSSVRSQLGGMSNRLEVTVTANRSSAELPAGLFRPSSAPTASRKRPRPWLTRL